MGAQYITELVDVNDFVATAPRTLARPTNAITGPPRCPTCGATWVERAYNVYENNIERRDRCGFLVGFDPGVQTADLAMTCENGHAFQVQLREHAEGWEVLSVGPKP